MVMVFLSGCGNQSEVIYQLYMKDPENMLKNTAASNAKRPMTEGQKAIDETQGELTICAPYSDWNFLNGWVITEFNKQYPNIKVIVNCLEGSYSAISDCASKVSVELMSGAAGDIIDLSGMPSTQYGKNNLLEDLYPYMENDPEFSMEDYYTNIFKAIEYKNKLYAMPMSFYYMSVRFNKALLEKNHMKAPEGDSIDFKEILDLYHKIDPSNDKLILSHYWDSSILEDYESISYIDHKNDKADFNSPGYIEFLNEIKSIPWPSMEEIRLARQDHYGMDEIYGGLNENDLCFFVGSFYQDKRNARLFYDTPNRTLPIPMSANNGDKGIINQNMLLGLISNSKNKDLAWKFIRFCIEEKPIEFLTNNDQWLISAIPINRKNALKMLETAFGEDSEEAVQMIDRWNSERNEDSDFMNAYVLLEAKSGILDEFFGGRITAQECAKQIQERVDIYLKE
jgi:ABC-type glycerol-3-phosphate transport system substrate-binding protein